MPRLASSLAFSALFAIAPLFVILIAIAGYFIGIQNGGHGHHVAEAALLNPIRKAAGGSTADAVGALVSASFDKPRAGPIAQVCGWVAFALGGVALFASLQDALNTIWRVEANSGGWKRVVRDRLASFAMILIVSAILLATVFANAAAALLSARVLPALPGNSFLLAVASAVVSLVLLILAFALVFKILPDAVITWRQAWTGAAITAVFFTLGESLIAWYLAFAGVASAYGAAGSLLVGLLWIYYSATIFLTGAEITKLVGTSK